MDCGSVAAALERGSVAAASRARAHGRGATGERLATLIRDVITFPGVRVTDDCPWKRVFEVWPDRVPTLADAAVLAVAATNRYDAVATFDRKLAKRLRNAGIGTYW